MKQSFCFSPRPWSTWSQFAIHNLPKMLLLQFTPLLQNHHWVPTIRFKCAGLVSKALPDLAPVCLSHYRAFSNPTLHPAPQVYLLSLYLLSSILLLQLFPSPGLPSVFHEIHPTLAQSLSRSVVSESLRPHGLQPPRLLHPWDFLGKSTGVGCHFLLHIRP